jgi:predicted DNA binding CopG/RHH family protein
LKTIQKFSDEYLERCREMSHDDIVRFLDDFRRVHGNKRSESRLISMKVPVDLLAAFKAKARLRNVPYQTQIKKLMVAWLKASH